MEFLRADIRPGGGSLFMMTNGQFKMYGRAHYLEIEKPERLVYTQQFCDEKENLSRHPAAPTWPATMLTTVTFASEPQGGTRVRVQWQAHGEVTAEELATFVNARAA